MLVLIERNFSGQPLYPPLKGGLSNYNVSRIRCLFMFSGHQYNFLILKFSKPPVNFFLLSRNVKLALF